MKDFAAGAGRLRVLPLGAKLLYTAFAISAIVGLVVSWRLYSAAVGDAGAPVYYAGAEVRAEPPDARPAAGEGEGPALDLPDEARAPRVMTAQISERKLLEVTHFHLFSVPVYVLILAHLWLLVRLPPWLSAAGVIAAVAASGLHIAAPWLVRGRAAVAGVMPASGVAMLLTLGVIALVPSIDMWLPRGARRAVARGAESAEDDPS